MKHWLSLFIITVVATIVFVFFFLVAIEPKTAQEAIVNKPIPSLTEPTVTIIDPILGNPKAPVTIIEFGDFQCAFCKEASANIQQIVTDHPAKVRLVWKDLPNENLHPLATASAVAARCAGEQNMYWEFHDELFKRQEVLSNPTISSIASDLGLDMQTFDSCVSRQETLPRVQKSFEEAQALGVPGTPYLYINGQAFNGSITYASLKAIVDSF